MACWMTGVLLLVLALIHLKPVMPDLSGLTFEEAVVAVKKAGFTNPPRIGDALYCVDHPIDDDRIACQEPYDGAVVSENQLILVTLYHPDGADRGGR
ncbi:MAG: PASTA domain-containing protein [Kofleriaceae bacterium]